MCRGRLAATPVADTVGITRPTAKLAGATSGTSVAITAMRVYVDSVSAYLVSAAKLNTNIAMSRGSHSPLETQEAVALEPAPFPTATLAQPDETGFVDWRVRLTHNLSRRSDGRWDPLTRVHRAGA